MRTKRLLGVAIFLFAPASALAFATPVIASPFAHLVPLIEVSLVPEPQGQTAAAAQTSDPGINDICWDEFVTELNGKPLTKHTQGANYQTCESQKITQADCTNPEKSTLVGKLTYQNSSAVFNRCTKPSNTAVTRTSVVSINASTPSGQNTMVQMYQTLGVSPEQAQNIVSSNPDDALKLLAYASNGNPAAA